MPREWRICLWDDLADVATLNVTAEDEHIPEAERYIRMLKERAGAAYAPSSSRGNDDQNHEDRDDDGSNVRLDTNDLDGTVLATEEVTTTTAVVTTEGVVRTAVAPPEGVTEAMDK